MCEHVGCVPNDMLLVVVVCAECVNMSACVPNDMLLVVVVCAASNEGFSSSPPIPSSSSEA